MGGTVLWLVSRLTTSVYGLTSCSRLSVSCCTRFFAVGLKGEKGVEEKDAESERVDEQGRDEKVGSEVDSAADPLIDSKSLKMLAAASSVFRGRLFTNAGVTSVALCRAGVGLGQRKVEMTEAVLEKGTREMGVS